MSDTNTDYAEPLLQHQPENVQTTHTLLKQIAWHADACERLRGKALSDGWSHRTLQTRVAAHLDEIAAATTALKANI